MDDPMAHVDAGSEGTTVNLYSAIREFLKDPERPADGASLNQVPNAADRRMYESTNGQWSKEECEAARILIESLSMKDAWQVTWEMPARAAVWSVRSSNPAILQWAVRLSLIAPSWDRRDMINLLSIMHDAATRRGRTLRDEMSDMSIEVPSGIKDLAHTVVQRDSLAGTFFRSQIGDSGYEVNPAN